MCACSYHPLEGTEEHCNTLDDLCAWVQLRAEEERERRDRAEVRRAQREGERLRREADPVWQEQQRVAAEEKRIAAEAQAAAALEEERKREKETRRREKKKKRQEQEAWQAKARKLLQKVKAAERGSKSAAAAAAAAGSGNGRGARAAARSSKASSSSSAGPLRSRDKKLFKCGECGDQLQFCSKAGCLTIMDGSCKCAGHEESAIDPTLSAVARQVAMHAYTFPWS